MDFELLEKQLDNKGEMGLITVKDALFIFKKAINVVPQKTAYNKDYRNQSNKTLKAFVRNSGVLYYENVSGTAVNHYVLKSKYCEYDESKERIPNSVYIFDDMGEMDRFFLRKFKYRMEVVWIRK